MATVKEILQNHIAGLPAFETESNLPRLSGILTRVANVLPAGPNLPFGDIAQSASSIDGVPVVPSVGSPQPLMIDLSEGGKE